MDSAILPLQPKRAAVLTYLMVARPGPMHRRDSLLAMFWPDHDAERGRNALSKVIHHLRRTLPSGAIVTQDDQVGIARQNLWCDVTEFERALEEGRAEEAVALYRGELLEGFHISGSPDFDHWADIERSRLQRMAVATAWDLASHAQRAGESARATELARQAVEWSPRDESGFRRLLTLLHRRGNRAEALEAFETFAHRLRRDYGVDPADPTLELIDAIREGSLPSDLAAPVPWDVDPWSPSSGIPTAEAMPDSEAAADSETDLGSETPEPEHPSGTTIGASAPPHPDSKPRRRFVFVALAAGLVGLTALALLRGPFSMRSDLEPTGSVLVSDFDDRTGEGLGAVVAEALRIDLAQSRALGLVDRADVVGTLELMGLEPGEPISSEVGRAIAVRDGLEVLVDGSVARAGAGYILTAAIRRGDDGRTIASFRESVTEPDRMIAAIDELSSEIREALGESVGAIRASLPLERVTTPSLEALTLYTRATQVFDQVDDRAEMTELLQRAVALDPGFAMAWRMIAVAVQGDADQSLRLEAVRRAYQQRDRLSELERYAVEAMYYATAGDRGQAVEAYLRILDVDPDDGRALNNLGISYLYQNDPERAEEMFRRLVRSPGSLSNGWRFLVQTRLYLGRFEEAAQALAEFEQAYPGHRILPDLRAQVRFLAGAVDEARAELRRVTDDPLQPMAWRADAWAFLGRIAYWEGRFDEGRGAFVEAERLDARADEATAWARIVETAHTAALVGDTAWARGHLETKLASGLPEDIILRRPVSIALIELLALTSTAEPGNAVVDQLGSASRLAGAYARIQAGDTVGLRAVIEELPLHPFQRALLAERLGDVDRTIELHARILQPGYTNWGSDPHRLRAFMRLGPLYEEAGDTVHAIDAYDALARRWAGGEGGGRVVADGYAARARALETQRAAGGS